MAEVVEEAVARKVRARACCSAHDAEDNISVSVTNHISGPSGLRPHACTLPHAGEDAGGSLDPALVAILFAAGRKVESFPADFAAALLSGKVGLFAIIAIHAGIVPDIAPPHTYTRMWSIVFAA